MRAAWGPVRAEWGRVGPSRAEGRVGPVRAEWGWGGVGHALGFNTRIGQVAGSSGAE